MSAWAFLECSLLPPPVWPLPICLDSWTLHSSFLCNIALTAWDLASITSHIHSWVLFCFGSIPSFFLELFLHWSPVAYWVPSNLGSSSFRVLSFYLFILFMGFSRQEYWSVLHSLLQWTTFCLTSPPWPVHLGRPHTVWLSSIELDKDVVCLIRLASSLWYWFQSVCPQMPSLSAYCLTWELH